MSMRATKGWYIKVQVEGELTLWLEAEEEEIFDMAAEKVRRIFKTLRVQHLISAKRMDCKPNLPRKTPTLNIDFEI